MADLVLLTFSPLPSLINELLDGASDSSSYKNMTIQHYFSEQLALLHYILNPGPAGPGYALSLQTV